MTSDSDVLSYFLYRSFAVDSLDSGGIGDILGVARARNDLLGLTGLLHCEDGMFFQWLEGTEHALRAIVASICADPRHRDIVVLGHGPLKTRYFRGWAMRLTGARDHSIVDWLASRNVSIRDERVYGREILHFMQEISGQMAVQVEG
ncbi:MAG: BLUF domain-containing protein [Paracoccus sp. (in: a-proteobacteria)]|uniref:BLUF domain-containing protein n=1 Tax=Paracoccus sp. TaxID=267 RepID=UPI0026DFA019|nr:BLUF domain-containing protein [Paracoccus sp. (in: a-proteobacteria)]MDO5630288.1 BLUF domain-containing protein [Paracoccus sp. (in: a-proteobacteria)]